MLFVIHDQFMVIAICIQMDGFYPIPQNSLKFHNQSKQFVENTTQFNRMHLLN